jgi:hypothetical protein
MATTWASEYMLAEDTVGILDGIPVVMTGLGGQIVHDQLN